MLWIRGADDQIVSDSSFLDFGTLGKLGYVPGWPGDEAFPSQPMVSQIRYVLDGYAARGGRYTEVVVADCGHSPHIEKPDEFRKAFFALSRGSMRVCGPQVEARRLAAEAAPKGCAAAHPQSLPPQAAERTPTGTSGGLCSGQPAQAVLWPRGPSGAVYAILACATDTGIAVGRAGRSVNATANGRLRWSGGAIRWQAPARSPQHAVRRYCQNCINRPRPQNRVPSNS